MGENRDPLLETCVLGRRDSATMAFLALESLTEIYWRQLHQSSVNHRLSRDLRKLKAIHLQLTIKRNKPSLLWLD